ncbi:MAG: DNA mismatch repair protein MutS [Candidatus Eisenbacteria bacterium]|nr:DNA mismatch repair protein MutS [Candidatus Eisenbacteria bacterium]
MRRPRSTTPMMEQYLGVKEKHPDTVLLYRMGDFYETFYDDAVTLSRVLGIALTSRNPGDAEPIPLAGIPWHSAEPQVAKLLRAGHRVAICEQVGSAEESKGLIERRVIEVMSPGTAVTDPLLTGNMFNYLAAVHGSGDGVGLAVADISTGAFLAGDLTEEEAEEELARLAPSEILQPEGWASPRLEKFLAEHLPGAFRTSLDGWRFSPSRADGILREQFRVATLEGYGFRESTPALGAAAALIEYAREQKQSTLAHLGGLQRIRPAEYLILDDASIRGLEILEPLAMGGREATLVAVLDRTRTAAGGRRLREALARPFRAPEPARARQDRIASLLEDGQARSDLARSLEQMSDIERILGRVHCERATPRDLAGLRRTLLAAPALDRILAARPAWSGLQIPESCEALGRDLHAALVEQPAISPRDGEVIKDGHDRELDAARDAARGGKRWMADLESREREATGIANLKVGYNRVFGYYIEVTRSQISRVPERYLRRQTLSTGERYVTPEIKEQEELILGAEAAVSRRQEELFGSLCGRVAGETAALQDAARAIAEIDLVLSLAEVAIAGNYAKPQLQISRAIHIEEGRHPVVERAVGIGSFVPNDLSLDGEERQIVILTGPNMAGKSTYLRQTGLIVLMAQIGSYVPARAATIGMADRIFTRVGAHDVLARGQSTFLVEMVETSNILRHATSESLVLMDEVGRGTSTYDGVSIAWSVAEALRQEARRRPRVIFATHFHELTRLGQREGYVNLNVLVREWGDEVIFLRKVIPGGADRSYGIEVARLAGVPETVVRRAAEILRDLERGVSRGIEGAQAAPSGGEPEQLPLFAGGEWDWLVEDLAGLDPSRLTPLDALERIHRWVERVDRQRRGSV